MFALSILCFFKEKGRVLEIMKHKCSYCKRFGCMAVKNLSFTIEVMSVKFSHHVRRVVCADFAAEFGRNNVVFPCWYSQLDNSMVITELDIQEASPRHFFTFIRSSPSVIWVCLKGPKLEIVVAEFFTQSKPVWVDDLGTRK